MVISLFFLILFLLGFYSILSTCGVYSNEVSYFVRDSVWLNLAAFVLVGLLFFAVKIFRPTANWLKRLEDDPAVFIHYRRILLLVMGALALVWVLATQCQPGADQEKVQEAVYGLNTGDYSSFTQGYLAMRHHQLSVTWVFYLFSLVFGSYNAVAFQVFNVLGLVLFYRELSQVCLLAGLRKGVSLATVFTGILFYPLILYCSFVYGNIWGLALSLLAIRLELQFFKTHRFRYGIFSALAITGALFFKFNYIIFLIGMALYGIVAAVQQKKVRLLLLPALMIVSVVIQSMLPIALARQVTGDPLDKGASTWAWAAMGLQREGPIFPGWYNNYDVYSYEDSGRDAEVQTQLAKENIGESIQFFTSNPGEAARFFTRKIASQWNNPTFQCYWITQTRSDSIYPSAWTSFVSSKTGEALGTGFLNLLQFVLLAGAVLYCVFSWKKFEQGPLLMLAMIFVGGFLFHLVWEAKAQYTLSYFVLLIPFAMAGYSRLTDGIVQLCSPSRRNLLVEQGKKRWKSLLPFAVMTVLMIVLLVVCYAGPRGEYLTADTQAVQQYFAAVS